MFREYSSALPQRSHALIFASVMTATNCAMAAGGPFGIDHRLSEDNHGIWARRNQLLLQSGVLLTVATGALWEGDGTRLGHTLWQSVDAIAIGSMTSEGMKYVFSRTRPASTDDPNRWFRGRGNKSFPSGEVMSVTTAITPIVLEYGADHPEVWALELLPLYDAVARVKVRGHWQSDVLASFLLGTAIGAYTHSRSSSIAVGLLPGGVSVGWKRTF